MFPECASTGQRNRQGLNEMLRWPNYGSRPELGWAGLGCTLVFRDGTYFVGGMCGSVMPRKRHRNSKCRGRCVV